MGEDFDAHRVIGLIHRNPKKKWKFTVRQFMLLRMHVAMCYECHEKVEKTVRENPRIGPPPEAN